MLILISTDISELQSALYNLFKRLKHEPLVAENSALIDILQKNPDVQLIFMEDHSMIGEVKEHTSASICLMSCQVCEEEAQRIGADYFLSIPFTSRDAREMLEYIEEN